MVVVASNKVPQKKFSAQAKEIAKTITNFLIFQFFFLFMMLSFSIGGKAVFGVVVAVGVLMGLFVGTRKGLIYTLNLAIGLFVVGQRTLFIGEHFRIVPAGVVLWILTLTCLLSRTRKRTRMPVTIWILAFGVIPAIFSCTSINLGLFLAHMMWLAIPGFFVMSRLVVRMEEVQNIYNTINLGCFFLGFMAINEYYNTPLAGLFSGYFVGGYQLSTHLEGGGGFHRMGAGFWGGPFLAGYMSIALPFCMSEFFVAKTPIKKAISLGSILLSLVCIYLSGHRGIWVPTILAIFAYIHPRGIKSVFLIAFLCGAAIMFAPQEAKTRMSELGGQKKDTSSQMREGLALGAIDLITQKPITGHGWGVSGLVHSDFLQLWADTGLIPFVCYILIFLQSWLNFKSTFKRFKNKEQREYICAGYGFLASSFSMLWIQAWFNLSEQYIPFWMMLGLLYHLRTVFATENKIAFDTSVINTPVQSGGKPNA